MDRRSLVNVTPRFDEHPPAIVLVSLAATSISEIQ